MIDVNDLNKIDCKEARSDLDAGWDEGHTAAYRRLSDFIDQIEALQRKYTKPIAALLKGPNG